MTSSQLESLIQREAEKHGRPYPSWRDSAEIKRIEQGKVDAFTAGASLLLQPFLEALGALDNALWCAENFQAKSEEWQNKHHKATESLQRIKELLGGGK